MDGAEYLRVVRFELERLKKHAEAAMAQTSDENFFRTLDPEANSIALLVKHMAGNMRSRWTEFLTTDGEKPDRRRDSEFEIDPRDTRTSLMHKWESSWQLLRHALELSPDDLDSVVTIRGEPHTVIEAIHRQLTHYAAHIGQIVLLAKHWAGDRWKTLSIPRGKSEEFLAARKKYLRKD